MTTTENEQAGYELAQELAEHKAAYAKTMLALAEAGHRFADPWGARVAAHRQAMVEARLICMTQDKLAELGEQEEETE